MSERPFFKPLLHKSCKNMKVWNYVLAFRQNFVKFNDSKHEQALYQVPRENLPYINEWSEYSESDCTC